MRQAQRGRQQGVDLPLPDRGVGRGKFAEHAVARVVDHQIEGSPGFRGAAKQRGLGRGAVGQIEGDGNEK